MTDVYSREKRSEVMSKIRAKNTKPEMLVRQFLFSKGFRFRIHVAKLPGKPDIVLKKYNTVILVNGCFWHDHKNCKIRKVPKTRQHYWIPKIEKNTLNDLKNQKSLKKLGWNVIVIWECELTKSKRDLTLSTLVYKIFS